MANLFGWLFNRKPPKDKAGEPLPIAKILYPAITSYMASKGLPLGTQIWMASQGIWIETPSRNTLITNQQLLDIFNAEGDTAYLALIEDIRLQATQDDNLSA